MDIRRTCQVSRAPYVGDSLLCAGHLCLGRDSSLLIACNLVVHHGMHIYVHIIRSTWDDARGRKIQCIEVDVAAGSVQIWCDVQQHHRMAVDHVRDYIARIHKMHRLLGQIPCGRKLASAHRRDEVYYELLCAVLLKFTAGVGVTGTSNVRGKRRVVKL